MTSSIPDHNTADGCLTGARHNESSILDKTPNHAGPDEIEQLARRHRHLLEAAQGLPQTPQYSSLASVFSGKSEDLAGEAQRLEHLEMCAPVMLQPVLEMLYVPAWSNTRCCALTTVKLHIGQIEPLKACAQAASRGTASA